MSKPKAESSKPKTNQDAGGWKPRIAKEKTSKPEPSMEDALAALKMKFKN